MPEGPGPTEVPANYLKILVLQVGVLSTAQVLLTHVDTTTFLCNLFPLCITHWPQKSHKLFASRRLKQLTWESKQKWMQKFKHIKDSVWISRTGTVTGRYLHFLTPELQYICQSKVHCSSNCLSKKQTKTRRLNPTHIDTPTCLLQILASIIGDFQQFPESAGASRCRGQDAPAHPLAKLCATCSWS